MMTVTARGVTWLILKEVMRLHEIPESIVSDRNTKFTSIFWKELHRLMGSKLLMSTAFHLQTDGVLDINHQWISDKSIPLRLPPLYPFHPQVPPISITSLTPLVRVPIFPIVVCVRLAYVIGAGVGFRVESGAVALLQLDL